MFLLVCLITGICVRAVMGGQREHVLIHFTLEKYLGLRLSLINCTWLFLWFCIHAAEVVNEDWSTDSFDTRASFGKCQSKLKIGIRLTVTAKGALFSIQSDFMRKKVLTLYMYIRFKSIETKNCQQTLCICIFVMNNQVDSAASSPRSCFEPFICLEHWNSWIKVRFLTWLD